MKKFGFLITLFLAFLLSFITPTLASAPSAGREDAPSSIGQYFTNLYYSDPNFPLYIAIGLAVIIIVVIIITVTLSRRRKRRQKRQALAVTFEDDDTNETYAPPAKKFDTRTEVDSSIFKKDFAAPPEYKDDISRYTAYPSGKTPSSAELSEYERKLRPPLPSEEDISKYTAQPQNTEDMAGSVIAQPKSTPDTPPEAPPANGRATEPLKALFKEKLDEAGNQEPTRIAAPEVKPAGVAPPKAQTGAPTRMQRYHGKN